MKSAIRPLKTYVATPYTAKHRFFVQLSSVVLPDAMVYAFAVSSPFYLGVLSSRVHETWSLATCSFIGKGNDPRYNNGRCFETFPFPSCESELQARVGDLAEALDAHRKRQQELHPKLTMTGMYNVLEKLRAGESLTAKEQAIHEQGLVSVLKQIHDDLDAAVFEAYGWPADLSDEEILQRLVELNAERAAEEARGIVRWLRPEFQDPNYGVESKSQGELAGVESHAPRADAAGLAGKKVVAGKKATGSKQDWPAGLPGRMRSIIEAVQSAGGPVEADAIATRFKGARKKDVRELTEALESLGQLRRLSDGRYAV